MIAEDKVAQGSVEERLKKEGIYISKTRGISMRPLFKTHRDAVMIAPPSRELRKYDIVLYTYGDGRYILHRIVGFKDGLCLIRGDNTYVLECVPKERIIGVAVAFNRNGKRYDMSEISYKMYSRFWNFIYPLRYIAIRTRRLLSRIKHKIFK